MNASSPDLPLASVVAQSECDETISVFTAETNYSTDLMTFFNKQFPEIEERNKNPQASRRARFFQEVRTKTNIAYILNRNHNKQSTSSISPDGCHSTSVVNHALVSGDGQEPQEGVNNEGHFYDDQDDSSSSDADESTSASNIIHTGTYDDEEEEKTKEGQPNEAKPIRTRRHRRRADRLQVEFRHPNRHRLGLINSPVGKALVRVKNKVLPPSHKSDRASIDTLRICSMNQARKFNSTELKGTPPPTWTQSRAMEKELAQTKLELAAIQTELDHNKALLKRTMEERDLLQKQHTTLQHEYQESQGMIHEYQTMVEHLKRHVRNEPAIEIGIDRPSNESSPVRSRGGLRLRARSPLRAFRPVA